MSLAFDVFSQPSRLRALLDHFSRIEDPRDPRRVAHPPPEALLLVVRGTMADCDDYESIAAWGEMHLSFPRKGHCAKNMAVVRHFAINLVASAPEPDAPPPLKPQRKATKPKRASIKPRRKIAGWNADYLSIQLGTTPR